MTLSRILKNAGYDLIEGPIRNHKLLQLWLKKNFERADFYYTHVSHAFKSDVNLEAVENEALSVTSNDKEEYTFNFGLTVLEDILNALGLGNLEITAKFKSGKSVSISYSDSKTIEYAMGELSEYFINSDFTYQNKTLRQNLNRNNVVIISGILFAKKLEVNIEMDYNVEASLIAELTNIAKGEFNFQLNGQSKIKMVSTGDALFPIAVRAHRIDYDRSNFDKLFLITDDKNVF